MSKILTCHTKSGRNPQCAPAQFSTEHLHKWMLFELKINTPTATTITTTTAVTTITTTTAATPTANNDNNDKQFQLSYTTLLLMLP